MPPVRARGFCHGLQHVCGCRDPYGVRWQFRVDFKQRLASRPKRRWEFQPGDHHGVMLVIVADEWKTSVSPGLSEPPIALWQREELMVVRDGPSQAQSRERTLHSMNHGHRATVVAHECRRVDDEGQFSSLVRHLSTSP
jgi:hypothetical protein